MKWNLVRLFHCRCCTNSWRRMEQACAIYPPCHRGRRWLFPNICWRRRWNSQSLESAFMSPYEPCVAEWWADKGKHGFNAWWPTNGWKRKKSGKGRLKEKCMKSDWISHFYGTLSCTTTPQSGEMILRTILTWCFDMQKPSRTKNIPR